MTTQPDGGPAPRRPFSWPPAGEGAGATAGEAPAPQVSVVVPVYRNANTLRELTERIRAALTEPHELLFVDDASPDDSGEVLWSLRDVRVITHDDNRGQNAAVLTGFEHARGEIIVVLDADLQDPPEAIPELLRAKRDSGAAIAFATRVGRYSGSARTFTSRSYKRVLSWLTGVPYGAGLFVALDRELADRVRTLAPMPSVVAALGVLRAKTIAVPVARRYSERSAYSGFDRLRLACRTLVWVLSHR